ncbi:hypothetical protein CYMTET_6146 [Cymbomonas tetramitiformis]|uniref:Uncharacterized protein n=1 Tax=Cymbomonas tetramitiformis TaxID=36881 RepID=A0AAE0GXU6_9CHLO|nr:hypothetical protein CYMTET_6146 [Cymbomonas tetramitiformis]
MMDPNHTGPFFLRLSRDFFLLHSLRIKLVSQPPVIQGPEHNNRRSVRRPFYERSREHLSRAGAELWLQTGRVAGRANQKPY